MWIVRLALRRPYTLIVMAVGFDAGWEAVVFGGLRRGVEAAQDTLEAARADQYAVLVSLLGEVGQNYLDYRSLQQRIVIANDNIEAQRATLGLTRRLFAAGLATELDVTRAESQVATTESTIPLFQQLASQTMHRLGVLLGELPMALQPALAPVGVIPEGPPLIGIGLPSELLRRRPDVRRAERLLAASTAEIGVATSLLYPRFFVLGTAGLESVDGGTLFTWPSRAASIGPSITWPVFEGGRIRAGIGLRTAQEEEALAAYENVVLQAFQEVEDALVAYAREQTRSADLTRAVHANQPPPSSRASSSRRVSPISSASSTPNATCSRPRMRWHRASATSPPTWWRSTRPSAAGGRPASPPTRCPRRHRSTSPTRGAPPICPSTSQHRRSAPRCGAESHGPSRARLTGAPSRRLCARVEVCVNELLTLSLVELTERLRARAASPVELMEVVLARIDETHGDLNAVVVRRDPDHCLAEAREAERRILRGDARPLEGVPLGVKELEPVAGLAWTECSPLFAERVASYDSIQVQRLKAAGAIVVGKTNAPEFGAPAYTKNRLYGVTRSPWNLDLTPGGSSGGSSAAIAACVLPLVTAGDGGGSIRIPASFTGCFGLKTSYGRVPREQMERWEYGTTAVYGPLTKTVADAALVLDQVVGASELDPTSLPHPGRSYLATLDEPPAGLRIGFSPDLGYAVVQSDVAAAVEDATRAFADGGHRVEQVSGGPPEAGRAWGLLGAFLMASQLEPHLDGREHLLGRGLLASVEMARRHMNAARFGELAALRAGIGRWCASIFERYDLLLTPTVPFDPYPAPGPYPSETEGRAQPWSNVGSFTIPFNLSWHPAATVRIGLSARGLPMDMQIVGPRHRDDLVLQAARAFERVRPWHPRWPSTWPGGAVT